MEATTKFIYSMVSRLLLEGLIILLQSAYPFFRKFIPAHYEYRRFEIPKVVMSSTKQRRIYTNISDIARINAFVLDIGVNNGAYRKIGYTKKFVYDFLKEESYRLLIVTDKFFTPTEEFKKELLQFNLWLYQFKLWR